jgi:hypothetical protein
MVTTQPSKKDSPRYQALVAAVEAGRSLRVRCTRWTMMMKRMTQWVKSGMTNGREHDTMCASSPLSIVVYVY